MALKTRQPTGKVPYPLILIEGAEKSGKSWACAVLSASPKVGQTYWIDFGEGAADEYAAIPGANYLVVDHDGSWADIIHQVSEIKDLAHEAARNSEPPVVLVIDSITAEWDLLKEWTNGRARSSNAGRAKLEKDPGAEIDVPMNLWNDANARHRRLMTMLMTFPGIVVLTARGKEVAELDAGGRPVKNSKVYKVEGHKTLAYDCSAWVRLSRDAPPLVVGLRSVHSGLRPGVHKPVAEPDLTLEWLIFDLLKCDPAGAHVRDLATPKPELTPEQIAGEALRKDTGPDRLRELWHQAAAAGTLDLPVSDGEKEGPLRGLLTFLLKTRTAAPAQPEQPRQETPAPAEPVAPASGPLATPEQHAQMTGLWRQTGMDDEERLRFTSEIVGRPITTSQHLTAAEAGQVIARVTAWINQQADAEAEAENAQVPA